MPSFITCHYLPASICDEGTLSSLYNSFYRLNVAFLQPMCAVVSLTEVIQLQQYTLIKTLIIRKEFLSVQKEFSFSIKSNLSILSAAQSH